MRGSKSNSILGQTMFPSRFLKLAKVANFNSAKCIAPSLVRCQSTAAAQELVLVDVDDKTGISTVTLNRPTVNSLNLELLTAISKTLDDLQNNKSRGMILTSVSQSSCYQRTFSRTPIFFSHPIKYSPLDWTSTRCTSPTRRECATSGQHFRTSG